MYQDSMDVDLVLVRGDVCMQFALEQHRSWRCCGAGQGVGGELEFADAEVRGCWSQSARGCGWDVCAVLMRDDVCMQFGKQQHRCRRCCGAGQGVGGELEFADAEVRGCWSQYARGCGWDVCAVLMRDDVCMQFVRQQHRCRRCCGAGQGVGGELEFTDAAVSGCWSQSARGCSWDVCAVLMRDDVCMQFGLEQHRSWRCCGAGQGVGGELEFADAEVRGW